MKSWNLYLATESQSKKHEQQKWARASAAKHPSSRTQIEAETMNLKQIDCASWEETAITEATTKTWQEKRSAAEGKSSQQICCVDGRGRQRKHEQERKLGGSDRNPDPWENLQRGNRILRAWVAKPNGAQDLADRRQQSETGSLPPAARNEVGQQERAEDNGYELNHSARQLVCAHLSRTKSGKLKSPLARAGRKWKTWSRRTGTKTKNTKISEGNHPQQEHDTRSTAGTKRGHNSTSKMQNLGFFIEKSRR
jgi:hypothetical protein